MRIVNNIYIKHALKMRFLLIGLGNTIVGILFFPILYFVFPGVRGYYLLLMVMSQVFCISFSYVTNKYFVFKIKKMSFLEYIRFTMFYNIAFFINLIFLPFFVSHWHMSPAKIQLMVNFFIVGSSYFWHQYVTFKTEIK